MTEKFPVIVWNVLKVTAAPRVKTKTVLLNITRSSILFFFALVHNQLY